MFVMKHYRACCRSLQFKTSSGEIYSQFTNNFYVDKDWSLCSVTVWCIKNQGPGSWFCDEHGVSFQSSPKINFMLTTKLICVQWKINNYNTWSVTLDQPVPEKLDIFCIKTESIRKLSNFNFQWTKTLYQNNLNNITFLFFTFFKGYR